MPKRRRDPSLYLFGRYHTRTTTVFHITSIPTSLIKPLKPLLRLLAHDVDDLTIVTRRQTLLSFTQTQEYARDSPLKLVALTGYCSPSYGLCVAASPEDMNHAQTTYDNAQTVSFGGAVRAAHQLQPL